ncbi:hypothetical protein SLS62_003550 [Diatrype stigma]|uniref:Carboxymuconolactone decarboxylase-like domain-containing protein n=1 Tax=Diatrype stigma TaxID=117547 RepID=A0AAN9USR0_9PEZI
MMDSATSVASTARHASPTATRAFSRLRVPDTATLPEDAQQIIKRHHGDNWTKALALNPDTLRRFITHYEDLFSNSTTRLEPVDREILAVVVSATNGCGFCRSHHTLGLAAALGGDESATLNAKKIALDWHTAPSLGDREKALASFAERLAIRPRDILKKDVEELRAQGLTDEEILEVVEVVGWFSHSNRLVIALGIEIDDRYLR